MKNTRTKITLGTSIAPGSRLEIQQEAIASWCRNGFEVYSFNDTTEILKLYTKFPDVHFIGVPRNAQAALGKPLVFVSDIISGLIARQCQYCGIINSDIFFPKKIDLTETIKATVINKLLIGSRLEVKTFASASGKRDPFGFDYMFFSGDNFRKVASSGFVLGMPMWDYWLPLEAISHNIQIGILEPPPGRHIRHEALWGEHLFAFCTIFVEHLMNSIHKQNEAGWAKLATGLIAYHHERLKKNVSTAQHEESSKELVYAQLEVLADFYDSLLQFAFKFISNCATPVTWQ